MNISLMDAQSAVGYDNYTDFKAMIAMFGVDGVTVFYSPSTVTVARRAVALCKSRCSGKFDTLISSGDFQFSASVAANFATDFPAAIVLGPNNGTLSVSL